MKLQGRKFDKKIVNCNLRFNIPHGKMASKFIQNILQLTTECL